MLKFKQPDDYRLLCVEMNRLDLLETISTAADVPASLLQEFIKDRDQEVSRIKDFRKSQSQKDNWRRNRRKYMRGINRFHDSTAGKRFHRSLGRFLATRDFKDKRFQRNDRDETIKSFTDIDEMVKGVSSAVTHAYIERQYYMPLSEQVDYELFIADAIPLLHEIEVALSIDRTGIGEDELNLLVDLVELSALAHEVSAAMGVSYGETLKIISHIFDVAKDDTMTSIEKLNQAKEIITSQGGHIDG